MRPFISKLLVILVTLVPMHSLDAATTTEMKYGSNNQSITCTLTSLTTGSSRQCTAVDNTSNQYLDAIVFVKIKTAASAVSGTGYINVFAAGTSNGGTDYTDEISCSDGAVTLNSPTNLAFLGLISANVASTTYSRTFSVASGFNNVLPDHWCIVVSNQTGASFDGTTATTFYQGVYTQNL